MGAAGEARISRWNRPVFDLLPRRHHDALKQPSGARRDEGLRCHTRLSAIDPAQVLGVDPKQNRIALTETFFGIDPGPGGPKIRRGRSRRIRTR
jgi:hypothetical protein